MKALVPVLTRAGMRAVFSADRQGLSAKVTHIAFGGGAYTPTSEETALRAEVIRVPVVSGTWVGDFTVHMTALLDAGPSFWLAEVGLILSDGTLLALWSDPTDRLAYKTEGVPIMTAFDLTLSQLPKNAVTVQAGDVSLDLFFGPEFARIGGSLIGVMLRATRLTDRIDSLEKRIAAHTDQIQKLGELRDQIAGLSAQIKNL